MNPLQATYRPSLRALPTLISSAGGGAAETLALAIPGFDEDEATMALAAAEPLFEAARIRPAQLRRVAISSRTASGFGPIVAAALGIPTERVEEATAILYGQTTFPNPGEGPVLQLHVDAPRPGRVPPSGVGEGAFARARLSGPEVAPGGDLDVSRPPREADEATVRLLAEWEEEAPKRMTMGAYVPQSTWDRSAPARYRLEGSECKNGHLEFPPRARCGRCGALTAIKPLPRPGTLETFTVVAKGAGPSEFEPLQTVAGEYAVGVASFGGARVPGMFTDSAPTAFRIGLEVSPTFRRLYAMDGQWRYGLKLQPVTLR